MKSVIIDKLNKELVKKINSESQVVYILAEVRKCLDQSDKDYRLQFPNLYFFCNWILHHEMSRTPAKLILQRFEKHTKPSFSLKDISNSFISEEARFYFFRDLRHEIRMFTSDNSLPQLILRRGNWELFRCLLVEILKDCPLINPSGLINKFVFIGAPNKRTCFRVHVRAKGSFKITLGPAKYPLIDRRGKIHLKNIL